MAVFCKIPFLSNLSEKPGNRRIGGPGVKSGAQKNATYSFLGSTLGETLGETEPGSHIGTRSLRNNVTLNPPLRNNVNIKAKSKSSIEGGDMPLEGYPFKTSSEEGRLKVIQT